ncbi:MAG: glycine cleavage system protein GcvH [Acidimicrobiales bacterium]
MNVPDDLRYSSDHEWVRAEADGRVRVGITDYAQDHLGEVVFVELPEVGAAHTAGSAVGEVESTKSVSEIYTPLNGTVVEVNTELVDAPERLNEDPYGDGWICVIELADDADLSALLDAEAYRSLTEG